MCDHLKHLSICLENSIGEDEIMEIDTWENPLLGKMTPSHTAVADRMLITNVT